ncbi:MAG: hypothetical protein ACREIC_20655, partial [Limisphaerales bacterium]
LSFACSHLQGIHRDGSFGLKEKAAGREKAAVLATDFTSFKAKHICHLHARRKVCAQTASGSVLNRPRGVPVSTTVSVAIRLTHRRRTPQAQ